MGFIFSKSHDYESMKSIQKLNFIYVATKKSYRDEVAQSIKQLRKVMPDAKVTLFTDQPLERINDIDTKVIKQPFYSNLDKVNALETIESEFNLFLDTDVFVDEDLGHIKDVLDCYEIAIAHASYRGNKNGFPSFNSGFFAFRKCEKVNLILKEWKSIMNRKPKGTLDQKYLSQEIYKANASVLTLPPEYNLRGGQVCLMSGRVKVLHLHWKNKYGYKLGKLIKFLNSDPKQLRIFNPNTGVLSFHDGTEKSYDNNRSSNLNEPGESQELLQFK